MLLALAVAAAACGTKAKASAPTPPPTADASDSSTTDAAACPSGASFAADPHNCGACGHDCLGGTCEAGACQPIQIGSYTFTQAAIMAGDIAIAVGPSDVYLVERSASAAPIVQMDIASGATSVFATDALFFESEPSVAGGNLLYSAIGDGLTGVLVQRALTAPAGTSPTTWSTSVQGDVTYDANDTGVFYVDDTGNIQHAMYGGSAAPFFPLAQMSGVGAQSLNATADRLILFAAEQPDSGPLEGLLYAVPISGGVAGSATLLTSSPTAFVGQADDDGAYWIDASNSSLMETSTAAPGSPQALTTAMPNAVALVLDARNVFWLAYGQFGDASSYELGAWDRTKGVASSVPTVGDPTQIADIAIDSAAVYWVTFQGAVYRVARS